MMFFGPRCVRESKGEIMKQGGGPEKKQASLCSDNVAAGRGWHSREIKLKNLNIKKFT
jgi:hypothetical protein